MDWFVILGPVFVLAVISLLGFAGCSFEGGSLPPDPPIPGTLTFRIRAVDTLDLDRVGFDLLDPNMVPMPIDAIGSLTTEPGFKVYQHVPASPAMGNWDVTAGVRATSGSPNTASVTKNDLLFPGDTTSWRADFLASGDPAAGALKVEFVDYVQV